MSGARPRVAIALPTYRRPARLAALLVALEEQIGAAQRVDARVVVVDNDAQRSAEAVAAAAGVHYVVEPRKGISAARNRSLDAARELRASALVFIDDDELPDDGWLAALCEPWLRGEAELVSGEVTTVFSSPPDPWIEAGGFFRRRRFPDGELLECAATNNLLIDLALVERLGLRFDDRFSATGGGDLDFTRRAAALGARIRSTPGARVHDVVDPERVTRSWVLQRAYRVGNSTARGDLLRAAPRSRPLRRARWAAEGLGRSAAGALRAAAGRLSGRIEPRARGARLVARGAGMLAAALGHAYREYDRRGA